MHSTTCLLHAPAAAAKRTKTEIGLGLAAFGLLFTVLGVMLFFDRGLLAMGNVSAESAAQLRGAAAARASVLPLEGSRRQRDERRSD